MTNKRYIHSPFAGSIGWTGALLTLLLSLSSCITDGISDCNTPIPAEVWVKVALSPMAGQDDINTATVSDIDLYLFDNNERLIEIRPTEIGKVEKFYYPRTPLTVTALANAGEGQISILPVKAGDPKNSGRLRLKPQDPAQINGFDVYCTVDDVIWGELNINAASKSGGKHTLDLPVRRKTSAVRIVMYNLEAYAEKNGWSGPLTVTLRSVEKYHQLDLYGRVSAATSEIRYKLDPTAVAGRNDVLTIPGEDSGNTYLNIFATDAGAPIEIEIFDGSDPTPVFTVTKDRDQNAITALNGKSCYIVIQFPLGEESNVEINVDSPEWGYAPPITGDF